MKRITLMLLATTATVYNLAWADLPVSQGAYGEVNGGYSKIVNANESSLNVSGLGLNFNLGYKLMPFAAVEVGYTTYGASKSSFVGANAIDAAFKGILPFQEVGVELFAKLGADYAVNSKVSSGLTNNAVNVYYGIGGDYALSPSMLLVIQWAQASGNSNTGEFQLLSIGASYIF